MSQSLKLLLQEQKKMLEVFEAHFESLEDEPNQTEIDLAALLGDIRGKIDATKFVIDALEMNASALREKWLKPIQRKCQSMEKEAERVRAYVKQQMVENETEKLPGNVFRAQIQKSRASVEVDMEPTASHFLAYPGLVVQKVNYIWDKDAIKARIDAGEELSFARLSQNKSLRFYTVDKSLKGGQEE